MPYSNTTLQPTNNTIVYKNYETNGKYTSDVMSDCDKYETAISLNSSNSNRNFPLSDVKTSQALVHEPFVASTLRTGRSQLFEEYYGLQSLSLNESSREYKVGSAEETARNFYRGHRQDSAQHFSGSQRTNGFDDMSNTANTAYNSSRGPKTHYDGKGSVNTKMPLKQKTDDLKASQDQNMTLLTSINKNFYTANYNIDPKNHSKYSDKNSRQELVESPHSKMAYKEFYRQFRMKERDSVEAAREYAEQALLWIPTKARWRVKLELADMAKRKNEFDKVCDKVLTMIFSYTRIRILGSRVIC
jgi:hypothetical protein